MRIDPRSSGFVWTAIVCVLLVFVLFAGDWIRGAVPGGLRLALCWVGAAMCALGVVVHGYVPRELFDIPPAAWTKLMGAAVLSGFLLFILFVQDIECEIRSSGRGIRTDCKDVSSTRQFVPD